MANGWTPERKARQAERIRNWKPWERSSGPKTDEGKAASSQNAHKHGQYSAKAKEDRKLVWMFIRASKELLEVAEPV